ncbi:MAG TPA: hypothetical protein VGS18_05535, partial [Thermoplasmata archaeon]|nr:hypothetical protein [Thermoplasmata archaeon]
GRVDVTGTTPPIPIQFNAIPPPPPPPPPPRFLLVFTEAGLMGGTWSVSLGASTLTAVAGASILFNVTAGSYDYAVLVPPGYTVLPSSGQVTAGPGPAGPISVRFLLPPPPTPIYPVTFLAAGLASATAWTVTLNGSTESSFGSSLTFEEPNGSYPYAVAQVAGYRLAPGPGSVGVRGGAASIAVTFTPINGTLNGTVNGTGVVVAVDGSAVAIVGGSFSVSLAPGTHTVTATGPGFAPYYNSVAIVPAQSTHLAIALTALPQPANTGLTPAQFDGILGGLLIVAVAVLVIGLLSRGRRGGGGGTTPPPGASVRAPKIDPVPASGPASAGETKADWSEA